MPALHLGLYLQYLFVFGYYHFVRVFPVNLSHSLLAGYVSRVDIYSCDYNGEGAECMFITCLFFISFF
jgi:hypothetical protein